MKSNVILAFIDLRNDKINLTVWLDGYTFVSRNNFSTNLNLIKKLSLINS